MVTRHATGGQHRLDFLSDSVIVHLDPDETSSITQCDCWRLTDAETVEPLPDHVCPATMRATVARWANRMAEPAPLLTRLDYPADAWPNRPQPVADFRIDQAIHWPLPTPRGYLGMVIEQWIQEPPNAALAAELAQNDRWREAIATTRLGIFAAALDLGIDELPDDLARRPVVVPEPTRRIRRQIAATLRFAGLPDTPRTVQHMLAAAAGKRQPLPALGLLVVTFVLVHPRADGLTLAVGSEPDVAIFGSIDAASGQLLDDAREALRQHRDWVGRHLTDDIRIDMPDIPTHRRPCGRHHDPDNPRYDYLAEAVRDISSIVGPIHHDPDRRREIVRDHLNDVYYRVHRRRKTAGLPLEPPQGWRVRARRRINDLLDGYPTAFN